MNRWLFIVVLGLAGAALFMRYLYTTSADQQKGVTTEVAQRDRIAGVGRLEPDGGIVALASPVVDVVESVYVRTGETVEAGSPLLSLQSRTLAQLAVEKALSELATIEISGEQTVKIQRLTFNGLEYAVKRSGERQSRLEKTDVNTEDGSDFKNQLDEANSELLLSRLQLERAREELIQTKEQVSANVVRARQSLKLAREQLDRTVLRAPLTGVILAIHKKAGEATDGPLISLADLSRMSVSGQFYEGDLSKIEVGRMATIHSDVFPEALSGTVIRVDRLINQESQTGNVTILLEKDEPANRFIHLQVSVVINSPPGK